jgi:hypothetical protein
MKMRYFVLDGAGQVRKASQRTVGAVWEGKRRVDSLGCPSKTELRLISVLCDDQLQPRNIYLLRVPLTDGMFTPENQLTLQIFTMRDCVTSREVVEHHGGGWPVDLHQQLAVVLDVPLVRVRVPLRVGGPLFLAAAMGVAPHQAVHFLR